MKDKDLSGFTPGARSAHIRLFDFLESEVGQYSGDWDIKLLFSIHSEDRYVFAVTIWRNDNKKKTKTMRFAVQKDTLSVSMYEDNWEEIADYNSTVKYFWIAFMDWPF